MAPYAKLDQFGTPRDVGNGHQRTLVKKIKQGKYDVVYSWTRYNNHASRDDVKRACDNSDNKTRYVEIQSFSYIIDNKDNNEEEDNRSNSSNDR